MRINNNVSVFRRLLALRQGVSWFVILPVALALRLISLDQSLWLDEAIEWWAVKSFGLRELLTGYMVGDFNPPGHHVLMWFWVRIFGESEIALRMPSVLFGVGTVFWTYKISEIIYKKSDISFLAAGMAAVNGLLIYYSQEARMYAMATFFVSGAMYFFIRERKLGSLGYLGYFAFMAGALYSHYLTWLMLPFLAIWGLRYVLPVLVTIPWWPMLAKQLSAGMAAAGNPVWAELSRTNFKNLGLVAVKFVTGRVAWPESWWVQMVIGSLVISYWLLVGRGGIRVFREFRGFRDKKTILIFWAFGPLILGAAIGLFVPVFTYFRFLSVVPAVMILAAKGIERLAPAVRSPLPSRRYVGTRRGVATAGFGRASGFLRSKNPGPSEKLGRLGILGGLGIFSLAYLFNPEFQREDWRGAVGELRRMDEMPMVIIHPAVKPPFDYYDRDKSIVVERSNLAAARLPAGQARLDLMKSVWYIPYAQAIFDPRDSVRKELNNLGYVRDYERHFRGVTLEKWVNYESIARGVF